MLGVHTHKHTHTYMYVISLVKLDKEMETVWARFPYVEELH